MRASIEVELCTRAGRLCAGRAEDVSAIGLRIVTAGSPPVGTHCGVILHVDGDRVDARGAIVRVQDGRVAVRFDDLPFESYERLRVFLLQHATDPSALGDELSERLGFLGETLLGDPGANDPEPRSG